MSIIFFLFYVKLQYQFVKLSYKSLRETINKSTKKL